MKQKQKKRYGFKILIGFLAVIAVTGISVAVWYFSTVNYINITHKPSEVVVGDGEKQALVIYEPSKHDTAKSMSQIIAEVLAGNGYTVTMNYPSQELPYDLSDYDLIVFGSPVYSGKLSPVLKEYVDSNSITGKHILLFVVGMYPEDTKELSYMETWISQDNTTASIKVSKEDQERLTSFIINLLENWG